MEGLSQKVQQEIWERQAKEAEKKSEEARHPKGEAFEQAREAFMNKFNERIKAWLSPIGKKKQILLPGGQVFVDMVSKASADNFEGSLDYVDKDLEGKPYREIIYLDKMETEMQKEKMEEKAAKEGRLRGNYE